MQDRKLSIGHNRCLSLFQCVLNIPLFVSVDSFDLLILREMLTKMGGIEVSEEITDQHLQAMCGGDLLRQEVRYASNFI